MYAIEVKDISKKHNIYERPIDRLKELLWRNRRCYHREFWALRDLTVNFEQGVTTALLGPNGAGKSTLLQIIAGVLQPTSGHVRVNGRLTAILELGAGFQPDYSGRENVILNGMILGIPRSEMLERMDEIAEFAEIGDFFDQPIGTYSSGMVVRLAFASAINVNPDILLVDEALAVGDAAFQKKCVKKIRALKESGKTILFVSHNMAQVTRFCDQAVVLNGGRLLKQGPIDEVIPLYEEIMEDQAQIAPKVFTQPVAAV
ncbi:MAG TPA: ABC transporter ATP-binding protein [Candidatus Obscuribacterales bacterium]